MEREVGGGTEIGNTCKPLAVSFQCMTKSTTNKKKMVNKKKKKEYWSRLPFSTPGDLPDSEIEALSLGSPALAGKFFTTCFTSGQCSQLILC